MQTQNNAYDSEMMGQLKEEILNDLEARREWQENNYNANFDRQEFGGYGGRRYGRGRGMGPGRYWGWCPAPAPMYRNRRPPEFDLDWAEQEEYDYQRQRMLLRRNLLNELRSVSAMNRPGGQTPDPRLRQMVYELLQETRQQGMGVPDLVQSLQAGNGAEGYGGFFNRLTAPVKTIDRRSFGWGVGASLLGLLFLPSLGKSMRGLARKAVEETIEVTDRAQGFFTQAKEEFEDIVSEANFNRLKDSVSRMTQEKPPSNQSE